MVEVGSNQNPRKILAQLIQTSDVEVSFQSFMEGFAKYVITEHCSEACFNDELLQCSYGTLSCNISGTIEIAHDDVIVTTKSFQL
jgi:hypothetical protein